MSKHCQSPAVAFSVPNRATSHRFVSGGGAMPGGKGGGGEEGGNGNCGGRLGGGGGGSGCTRSLVQDRTTISNKHPPTGQLIGNKRSHVFVIRHHPPDRKV